MRLRTEALHALASHVLSDAEFERQLRVNVSHAIDRLPYLTGTDRAVLRAMSGEEIVAAITAKGAGGGGSAYRPRENSADLRPGSVQVVCSDIIGTRTAAYGVLGTDLGACFEADDRVFFLFGDTQTNLTWGMTDGVYWPYSDTSDCIGWVDRATLRPGCLDLHFVTTNGADPGPFQPLIIREPPPVPSSGATQLGLSGSDPYVPRSGLEVPTGGASVNGQIYVFAATDRVTPNPSGRATLLTRSVLAKRSGSEFAKLYDVSSWGKFSYNYPLVTNRSHVPLLPPTAQTDWMLVWGTGYQYRRSDPFLAAVPIDSELDRSTAHWAYFSGIGLDDAPIWRPHEENAVPLFEQRGRDWYPESSHGQVPGMGELSVTYERYLGKWLMMYNFDVGVLGIYCRWANDPWGPWSAPTLLVSNTEWKSVSYRGAPNSGLYAPMIIPSLTSGNYDKTCTVYFLISTWDPYGVQLLKASFDAHVLPNLPGSRVQW